MDAMTEIGKPAPDFSLSDLAGKKHKLSDYRGQVVVVNFWSAACPWAARGDEEIQARQDAWEGAVVVLPVASNANEPREDLVAAAKARGVAPVLHDVDQAVARLYGAETTPHIFVIDEEGVLRYQGALDDRTFRKPEAERNYLEEAVAAVRAGRAPEPAETPPYGCTVEYHRVEG